MLDAKENSASMKLFKLKSFDGNGLFHVLDMIVNERLYLSRCDSMNDINEGNWEYTNSKDNEYIEKAKKLREIIDAQRFTCFLASINNPLMWAHYAGGFSGVALEYNFDPEQYDIRKIDYDGIPSISKDQMKKVIAGELLPQDIGILKQKSGCWGYEDEWRLYGKGDAQYIENIRPQAVILGVKKSKYISLLREITRRWGIKVGYLLPVPELNYNVEYFN